MQKIIGIICVVIGLWLLRCGYNIDHSIGSEFTRTFTGSPLGKATHNYVAGIIIGLLGVGLFFWKQLKI